MQPDNPTKIDPELVTAYRAAEYHVTGVVPHFAMRIDEASPPLAALHAARGATCSALLTACNPASEAQGHDENTAAQRRLAARLAAAGFDWVGTLGVDPSGHWPAEPSMLVLGLEPASAMSLARDFGQNALLWAGVDATPRLLLLR